MSLFVVGDLTPKPTFLGRKKRDLWGVRRGKRRNKEKENHLSKKRCVTPRTEQGVL